MNDHQALVSSTWDADQTALRDWVNCIVHAQHQAALRENLESFLDDAATVIRAELEARKANEHRSLSSFLATVYKNIWRAKYGLYVIYTSERFEDMVSGLPHLPTLPALFRGDLDAMLEQGKKQCLVQVIHDFVSDKYLEPKYAKTLLKPIWSLPALSETRSLQDEFNHQLQQKKAATEKAPQASTTEVAAINTSTKQVKIHADGEASDIEMDDLEKSMENAKDEVSRAKISERLVDWRVKKLWSMLEPLPTGGYWTHQDITLRILREVLSADTAGAYKALRLSMDRLKKTEAGKWYCVRTFGIDPGTFRDAERIEDRPSRTRAKCDRCKGLSNSEFPKAVCLRFESIGGRKGATKVAFANFEAF